MKKVFAFLAMTAGALCIQAQSSAQVTVEVGDSNAPWLGFMNVSETPANGGAFVFGSAWGVADLDVTFDDANNNLFFAPAFVNDPDPFWYDGGGAPGAPGNKFLDANLYQEITDGSAAGQTLTFNYDIAADTTTAQHEGFVFIRDFVAGFGSVTETVVPISSTGAGSINQVITNDPTNIVQYGIALRGVNAWETEIPALGGITVNTVSAPPAPPIPDYSQDFDGLTQGDTAALSGDGWLTFGVVEDSAGGFKFEYGPFGAPNDQPSSGFSDIAEGQGANGAGDQYLNTFSDYSCCDLTEPAGSQQGHGDNGLGAGNEDVVQSTLFREYTVSAADVGRELEFAFDIKLPDGVEAPAGLGASGNATAKIFMKTLDPTNSFAETGIEDDDILTEIPGLNAATWTSHSLTFTITPAMVGNIFQFGIESRSSSFDPTGVYIDNINLADAGGVFDPADLNMDGFVDGLDLGILLGNWGTNTTPDMGELDGTPPVDGLDLGILLGAWNPPPAAATAAVPEPTSLVLIGLSSLLLVSRRRC